MIRSLARSLFPLVSLFLLSAFVHGQSGEQGNTSNSVVPAQRAATSSEYVLGSEDLVSVLVMNHPELSGDFLVASDGNVQLPAVGGVSAAGRTLSQLSAAYAAALRTNKTVGLLRPVVTCSVKQTRSNRIYVIGEVKTPGVYDLKPGWRVTEALAAAGGLETDSAGTAGTIVSQLSDYTVTILHAGGGSEPAVSVADSVKDLPGKNPVLRAGDNISFRRAAMLTVYLSGLVQKPGIYQIRADQATIRNAISVAGGVAPSGSQRFAVIHHGNGQTEDVDLAPPATGAIHPAAPTLQSGDLITIPEIQAKIAVLGLVKQPGIVPLPETKEFHLSDALGAANGFESRARLGRVAVFTSKDGKVNRTLYNFVAYLRKGDEKMNPVLHGGDVVYVPETNTPEWTTLVGIGNITSFLLGTQGLLKP
jgi:polysaccharide export outer membrane protein